MKTNLQPLLNDTNGTNIKLRFVKLINYYLNQTKRLIDRKEKRNRGLSTKIEKKKNEVIGKKEEIKNINEPPLDESGDSNQAGGEEGKNPEEPLTKKIKKKKRSLQQEKILKRSLQRKKMLRRLRRKQKKKKKKLRRKQRKKK